MGVGEGGVGRVGGVYLGNFVSELVLQDRRERVGSPGEVVHRQVEVEARAGELWGARLAWRREGRREN